MKGKKIKRVVLGEGYACKYGRDVIELHPDKKCDLKNGAKFITIQIPNDRRIRLIAELLPENREGKHER